MRRRYLRELYAERVDHIKTVMPHACIGVDVIVGFPGETEEDFLETYRFINEMDISYLHVFTYSERANTPANEMADPVDMGERRRRNQMLRILSEKKKRAFYRQHEGNQRPVLFEESKVDGQITGWTDNYIKVTMPGDTAIINSISKVSLDKVTPEGTMTIRWPVEATWD